MPHITRRVQPGEVFAHPMPHSEVCVHMQVAGRIMMAQLAENGRSVQLFENGQPFSAPILPGGAGLYQDSDGYYFDSGITMVEYMDLYVDCT